jgi:acyl carrier protein
MNPSQNTFALLLQAINDVKQTGFTPDSIDADFYLGGDLGIDSREMLEIFYEIEQRLDIRVEDGEKRDLYTLADVVRVLDMKLGRAEAEAEAAVSA